MGGKHNNTTKQNRKRNDQENRQKNVPLSSSGMPIAGPRDHIYLASPACGPCLAPVGPLHKFEGLWALRRICFLFLFLFFWFPWYWLCLFNWSRLSSGRSTSGQRASGARNQLETEMPCPRRRRIRRACQDTTRAARLTSPPHGARPKAPGTVQNIGSNGIMVGSIR